MPPASRDGRKLGGIRDRRQTFGGDNRCVAASGTPIRCRPRAALKFGWLENLITIPTPPLDHTGVCRTEGIRQRI
jgi:hypothetical protein